jgi:cytoskeletal protein CcmA (bactofilin family)
MDPVRALDAVHGEANLGKSLVINGELSGSEDLYVDGSVQGTIDLKGYRLTVGPNGRVKANVTAKSAVVHGKLEGNINASDRVDLKHSAVVTGDISTQRISIDEGAYFKGGVDIRREGSKQESMPETKAAGAPAVAGSSMAPTGPRTGPSAGPEPRK